jgi:hypothetical protein
MMNRVYITGVVLVAALALSGVAVSSASANLTPGCYKVDEAKTGNYSESACKTKVATLSGEYVLAEPVKEVASHVWCALISPVVATGLFENAKCTKGDENGIFTYIVIPLPTLLLLSGKPPVELKGESKTAKTKLETKLGELDSEGYLFQLHWTSLENGSSGPASLLFTEVTEKTAKCSTTGDGTGLVLIDSAEWHLVYISLSPLQVGILALIPQFKIICGSVKETVKGSAISTIAPLETWEEKATGSFESVSSCLSNETTGVTKYWNDEAEEVTAKLEAEINGLGKFEAACENVEGVVKLIPTEMLEISQL